MKGITSCLWAEYLVEGRRLMQAYSDKLDVLRAKARVLSLKAVA
jgi:hypothetical protein